LLVSRPPVARRSLKPQLNQIRSWVRQGRTDAWIAHQLEVSARDITAFKREHDLAPDEEANGSGQGVGDELEVDLRAEDDALVAAALDAEPDEVEEDEEAPEAGEGSEADEASGPDEAPTAPATAAAAAESEDEDGDEQAGAQRPRRRRGRRGGRGRGGAGGRRPGEPLEGTFDHGEEGYGLWLDPAVQDDAVYAEHWAGHRPVAVVVEPDQIVIRRAGEGGASDDGAGEED
jgi:hypothetical protein